MSLSKRRCQHNHCVFFLIFRKNKAHCSQKTKSVGITMSTEYATVVRKNNTTSGETGDSMLVLNGMDRNKDTSRNKYVVI